MKANKLVILIAFLSLSLVGRAGEGFSNDSLYQGTQIKLDIASPIVMSAANKWKIQHYEIAANVRLARRFYPTAELGYAGGSTSRGDSLFYTGHGGFMRLGCDINPLKKHPELPHALLIGVRFGTAVQGAHGALITPQAEAKQLVPWKEVAADCWGEIVAGCQVEIAKFPPTRGGRGERPAFYMGWMGRFKFLFTRNERKAIYIPGYGIRDNTAWGLNYYLGWRF